ncbi:MAG TPA: hypothetical protein VF399_04315 [bacterium]
MRKLIVCIMGLCLSAGFAAWQSIGPYGGSLYSMGVAPSNNNIIYIASYSYPSSICKSTNAGDSWAKVSSIDNYIYFLAVDPVNPDIVYAGYYNVLYRSTNGGGSWTYYSMADYYFELMVHPTQPNILYAAGEAYDGVNYTMTFFKSTDSGVNWSHVHLNSYSGNCYCMGIDPSNPNAVYAGGYYYNSTYYPSVYKSTDGGASFADVSSGLPSSCYYVYSVAVHPTDPSIVYAGAYNGIYRSTIGGGSWVSVYAPYGYVQRLATTNANPAVVYAGADTAVYKSTDNGLSWSYAGAGLRGKSYRCLAVHDADANMVYLASANGFFKSTNGGSNWLLSVAGMNMATINSFGIAPSMRSTVYTEAPGIGIFKTTDNGASWTSMPTPLSCGNICAFAVHNTGPNNVCGLEGSG